MRKSVGVVAMVFGLTLLVGSFALRTFGAASAGERLLDGARPTMRNGVAQLRADFNTLQRGTDQTVNEVVPSLANELGLSNEAFAAQVQQNYPQLGELFTRKEEVTAALDKTVTNLEAHSGDFNAADDLPAPGVSLEVLPIVLVAAGVALVVTGVLVLRRPGMKPVLLACAVGVALVVPTLALQVPQKSARAEDVIRSLNITDAAAIRTRDQFQTVADAVGEERRRFFPDVAAALGVSPDEILNSLGQQFPDFGAGLRDTDGLLARVEADVRFREQNVDEFSTVKDFPLGGLSWVLVGAGLVLSLLAGGEIVRERARSRSLRPGQVGSQSSAPGSSPLAATASRAR